MSPVIGENEFSDAFSTAYDAPGLDGGTGGCPPAADWSCAYDEDALTDMWADTTIAPVMRRSEILAWATLQALTAYQLAPCPILVRPCAAGCRGGGGYLTATVRAGGGNYAGILPGFGTRTPHVEAGVWVNSCGCNTGDCSCTVLCEAILPGPVGGIAEVWLDGVQVPASEYRVDNGNRLVSLNSETCWPGCQDMAAGPYDAGAFAVSYYQGAMPDSLTEWAAGLLAVEFFKACQGQKCRLPSSVSRVTRQGVSYEITSGAFPGGFTGIQEVDTVIRLFNPNGLTQAPVVSSPDRRRARVTTWGRW